MALRTSKDLGVSDISFAQITLDFMDFLQVFIRIVGETLLLSSVLSLSLRINLSYAAKMHGCQGKDAAKVQEILSFGVVFNRFMGNFLLLLLKKFLTYRKKRV